MTKLNITTHLFQVENKNPKLLTITVQVAIKVKNS